MNGSKDLLNSYCIDNTAAMLMIQSNHCKFLLWLFLCLAAARTFAQRPYFLIQSVKTKEITKVKRGEFLQCIQRNSFGQEEFVFGEVTTIRHDGVMMRTNPYIPGSGGFVLYDDIVNIDKVKLLKRVMLPSCFVGIALGQLVVVFQIAKFARGPMIGLATYFVMLRSIKRKRKSLFENRIPEKMVLITPGVTSPNNSYFESSSLNQPE